MRILYNLHIICIDNNIFKLTNGIKIINFVIDMHITNVYAKMLTTKKKLWL